MRRADRKLWRVTRHYGQTLAPDYTAGVSNEFADGIATISVERGTLLIIAAIN